MKKALLSFLLALIVSTAANAQIPNMHWDSEVGTRDTTAWHPVLATWGYSVQQFIYDRIESGLQYNTKVYGMSFKTTSGTQAVTRHLQIYLGTTSKRQFDSNFDYVPSSQLTLVYDGNYTFQPNDTLHEFQFNQPFVYNNETNILLYVRDLTGSYVSDNTAPKFYCCNNGTQKAIYAYSDDNSLTTANVSTSAQNTWITNLRPCIQFQHSNYGIKIASQQIDGTNYQNVTIPYEPNAHVSYDPTTHELTIENLGGEIGFNARQCPNDLYINIVGNCGFDYMYASFHGTTTIDCHNTGSLAVMYNIEVGSALPTPSNLILKDGDFAFCTSEHYYYGINGNGTENLTIINSNVEVEEIEDEDYPAISRFGSINLNNCHIVEPVNGGIGHNSEYQTFVGEANNEYTSDEDRYLPAYSVRIERDQTQTDVNLAEERSFVIAPNPADDVVELQGININENAHVSIYNTEGKLVSSFDATAQNGSLSINVSNLAAGIYTVQVVADKTNYTSKLVKK